MKVENINNYEDFINFIVLKAIKNIVKYTDFTYEYILENNLTYDDDYHRTFGMFNIENEEDLNDKIYLQNQLKRFKTKLIRQSEYDIYSIM